MTVRTIDEIFRDFVIDGVPASGPYHPYKPDLRDTLKALLEGISTFPDNRVIRLNNANEGTENNIIVSASVDIPAAAFQVLYILNVTQENTGPVTVSGAINRTLVTNTSQPLAAGYIKPGMAVLCIDTGTELRMLSYGDVEAEVEQLAERAEDAAAVAESAAGSLLSNFDTVSAVAATTIPSAVNYARTAGFSVVGDGGAALYKRVSSEPSHAGKVKSDDGAWWEIVLDGGMARVGQFGTGQAAVEAAHTVADAIIIDREVAIATTAEWPRGKSYLFTAGGKLSVADDVTLTMRGVVHAKTWQGLPTSGPCMIFDCAGTGKVVGIRTTRPEWWGAMRNGTNDDAPAFNAAQRCMEASETSDGELGFLLSAGDYGIGSTVTMVVAAKYGPVWKAQGPTNGTRLLALTSFSTANGTSALQLAGGPSVITFDGCDISGFRVVAVSGTAATVGFLVGGSAAPIHGGSHSACIIDNVGVYGFATCWKVKNARLITMRKCDGWVADQTAGKSIFFEATSGETTGDIEVENCQFVAYQTANSTSLALHIAGYGANALVTGIRFSASIFYHGGVTISSGAAARVCDIWFTNGWQWDISNAPLNINCDGSVSTLYNINLIDGYFAGDLASGNYILNAFTTNSGRIRSVKCKGNTFINCDNDVVFLNGDVHGFTCSGNQFIDCSGGNLITIGSGVTGAHVNDNQAVQQSRTVSIANFVVTLSGANYYSIRNNIGNGLCVTVVNDGAAGTQKIIDGNL